VTSVGFIFYIYYALFFYTVVLYLSLYYYYLDKVLKPCFYPTQRTQRKTISDAKRKAATQA